MQPKGDWSTDLNSLKTKLAALVKIAGLCEEYFHNRYGVITSGDKGVAEWLSAKRLFVEIFGGCLFIMQMSCALIQINFHLN